MNVERGKCECETGHLNVPESILSGNDLVVHRISSFHYMRCECNTEEWMPWLRVGMTTDQCILGAGMAEIVMNQGSLCRDRAMRTVCAAAGPPRSSVANS